jgi:lipopolysaccharide transport system ATP-binding protein
MSATPDPPAPAPTIFHITHPKAGSQWIHGILRRLEGDRVVRPTPGVGHVLDRPLEPGLIYPAVYLDRERFEELQIPAGSRRFVVIRDLRDVLVSGYWSWKVSHPLLNDAMTENRATLNELSLHEGLMWMVGRWNNQAKIVESWIGSGTEVIRYEDLVADDLGILVPLLCDRLELPHSRDRVREAIESARFERRTKGRQRGSEDVGAHQRKGEPGDWRNYVVGPVADAFKERYGQLLIDAGYETDLDW